MWRNGRFLLMGGDEGEVMGKLLRGEGVIVSEVYANRRGLRAGDRVSLGFGGIHQSWDLLAVYRDYRTGGGVVFIDIRLLSRGLQG